MRPSTPPAVQAEHISDLEKFTGDREKLRTFKTHLLMKLQGDASRFPNTQHQLLYAIGRLSGSAFAQVETYIKPDGVHLEGVGKLLDVLDMAFGDPDSEATAERKLDNLKQKDRKFSLYYAEFQRYAADVKWNGAAKRTALHRGLNDEIKDALSLAPGVPTEFTQYAAYVQSLDNRIRARGAEKKGRLNPRFTPAPTAPRSTFTPTAPIPRTTPAPAPIPTINTPAPYPEPMDLSSGRRTLTPEERQKRIQEGRCLYCGSLGHLARACPVKPVRGNEAVLEPVTAEAPQPAEN